MCVAGIILHLRSIFIYSANREKMLQVKHANDASDIVSHGPEGKRIKNAPMRLLSLFIVCIGRRGLLKVCAHESVLKIGNFIRDDGKDSGTGKVVLKDN